MSTTLQETEHRTGATPEAGAAPGPLQNAIFVWCRRALVAFGVASLALGLALTFANGSPIFAAYNRGIAEAFYGSAELPPEAARLGAWLLATVGAGTAGWAVAFIYLAAGPFARGERWAHDCFVVSLVVWVALDVDAAIQFGVRGETYFVAGAAAAAAIPLALSRRYFREPD